MSPAPLRLVGVTESGADLSSIRTELRRASEQLRELNRHTAKHLLPIAVSLRWYSQRCQEVMSASLEAADLLSGDSSLSALADLEKTCAALASSLAAWVQRSAQRTEVLAALSGRVVMVSGALADLKRVSRNLWTLGVSTRIHSAGQAVDAEAFQLLAKTIKTLSAAAQDRSEKLRAQAEALEGRIRGEIRQLGDLEARRTERVEAILSAARLVIARLSAQRALSAAAAHAVVSSAGEVERHLNDVVVAVQYQDITRQRVERVCAALEDMAFGRTATGARPQATPAPATGGAPHCLGVQTIELRQVRDELARTSETIESHLGLVAQTISRVAAEAVGATRRGESVLAEMELDIASMRPAFEDAMTAQRAIEATIHALGGTAAQMGRHVDAIEDTAAEIELVGLNALIKAIQHAEQGGAGIDVIASAIQEVAEGARGLATELGETLAEIEVLADSMCGAVGSASADTDAGLEGIVSELSAQLEVLRGSQSRATGLLSRASEQGNAMAHEIALSVDALRSLMDAQRMVGAVMGEIRGSAAKLGESLSGLVAGEEVFATESGVLGDDDEVEVWDLPLAANSDRVSTLPPALSIRGRQRGEP